MVEIRRARPEDSDAITEVHVASVRGVDPAAYDDAVLDVWAAGAAATGYAIDDDGAVVLVAEREGEVVGFAEASLDDPELDKLYVEPTHGNEGVGTALAAAVERWFRGHGADLVYVEASRNAAPFYERVGYERIGEHRKTVAVDGRTAEMPVVDVEKSLR